MSNSRADRAGALERWADRVEAGDMRPADTSALRRIAKLADLRTQVDEQRTAAVRSARAANRGWSEIGAMLGVSKHAAQRKYSPKEDQP